MGTKELLNLAEDIRKTLQDVRNERQLSFVEKTHKYSIYDPISEKVIDHLPSVSTLLKNFSEPFNSFEVSIRMMDGDKQKAEELRNEWQQMGKDASSIGSYAHYKLEQYVWNLYDIPIETRKPYYNLNDEELLLAQDMLKNGVNMIHQIISKGFVPLDTETVMGSINLGYFGQCDNLWLGIHKNQLSFLMTDYKTNKTKNFEEQPYNGQMYEPFQSLKDTALSKYYIQQPLYAQLLKDMLKDTPYKDIPFVGFRIIHLRDGGKMYKIPLWVYEEVKKLYPIK
jgi:hypothetical protein